MQPAGSQPNYSRPLSFYTPPGSASPIGIANPGAKTSWRAGVSGWPRGLESGLGARNQATKQPSRTASKLGLALATGQLVNWSTGVSVRATPPPPPSCSCEFVEVFNVEGTSEFWLVGRLVGTRPQLLECRAILFQAHMIMSVITMALKKRPGAAGTL